MSKTSLEKYFNSLLPSLYEELLFFIPDKDIPMDVLQNIESDVLRDLFNKLLIVDKYEGPIVYEKNKNKSLTLGKASELEKNTYSLLDKKRELPSLDFFFIRDKYFEQIEFLVYITDWMNNNSNQVLNIDDTTKGLFYFQSIYYKKHFQTLLRHFYPDKKRVPRSNFDAIKIVEAYYPDIAKQNDIINTNNTDQAKESSIEEYIKTPVVSKRVKKQPLITEKEAEINLLKMYFGIKN